MEVEAGIQMVSALRLVDGCKLHLGCVAGEAHLFEHQYAVLDGEVAAHVVNLHLACQSAVDHGVQPEVHSVRHHERFGLLGCGVSHFVFSHHGAVGTHAAEQIHQLVDVGVV